MNATASVGYDDEIAACAKTLVHRFGREAPAVAEEAADREVHDGRNLESAFIWRMIAVDCRAILQMTRPE